MFPSLQLLAVMGILWVCSSSEPKPPWQADPDRLVETDCRTLCTADRGASFERYTTANQCLPGWVADLQKRKDCA
ncbi:MAG: hypothetical protein CL927_03015 [Deltaproteobacteria bacterium]|nr:hypothetical protein [Deltaproteobacteria bacterium]HCH66652.1 hypothetical protein [Deltaproteobacteria bacterium]